MVKRSCMGVARGVVIVLLITVLCCPGVAIGQPVAIILDILGGESGSVPGSLAIEASIDWDIVYANPNSLFEWENLQFNTTIMSGTEVLATINEISISVKADPIVTLGFAVTAGQYATSFSFSSPLMGFDPLTDAEAYATANVSITTPDTTLWGSYTGGKAYKALYNDTTTFALLVDTPVTSFSTENTGLFQALPGTITSMQSKFQFLLSAEGMAQGGSYYEITGTVVPEPASILLLGLGGLALLRKRRK